jgi:hypothetical protein
MKELHRQPDKNAQMLKFRVQKNLLSGFRHRSLNRLHLLNQSVTHRITRSPVCFIAKLSIGIGWTCFSPGPPVTGCTTSAPVGADGADGSEVGPEGMAAATIKKGAAASMAASAAATAAAAAASVKQLRLTRSKAVLSLFTACCNALI